MNETKVDSRAVPQAAKAIGAGRKNQIASASETTPKADDAGESAPTSRFPSPGPMAMPRSEPSDRSWLVALLAIVTIALVLGMLAIIGINAGLVTFDWLGPNAVIGVV